jgi:hypothetical protein
MNAHELGLDYFQIYDAANQWVRERVLLKDQFDEEPEKGQIVFLDWWANPASKNDEEIFDKRAHFTGYYLYQSIPDPTRLVYLENQFGEQKIIIGRAGRLLVPAAKRTREGTLYSRELSHYKVYQVLEGEPLRREVKLEDQFGKAEVPVLYPYGFAAPAEKMHEGKHYPIHNEKAHLVLYRIGPRRMRKGITVGDQFGRYYLGVYLPILLAVPSIKHEWKELKD